MVIVDTGMNHLKLRYDYIRIQVAYHLGWFLFSFPFCSVIWDGTAPSSLCGSVVTNLQKQPPTNQPTKRYSERDMTAANQLPTPSHIKCLHSHIGQTYHNWGLSISLTLLYFGVL